MKRDSTRFKKRKNKEKKLNRNAKYVREKEERNEKGTSHNQATAKRKYRVTNNREEKKEENKKKGKKKMKGR